MTDSHDYAKPLEDAIDRMRDQMAKPENVEKTHWLETPLDDLWASLDKNLDYFETATELDPPDPDGAFRRAANISNYAWMIAEKVAHDAARAE